MQTTDPAYRFRNACIQFLIEAYNIDNWTAFKWAGTDYFTNRFKDGASAMTVCNEYITNEVEHYDATR